MNHQTAMLSLFAGGQIAAAESEVIDADDEIANDNPVARFFSDGGIQIKTSLIDERADRVYKTIAAEEDSLAKTRKPVDSVLEKRAGVARIERTDYLSGGAVIAELDADNHVIRTYAVTE